MENPSPSSKVLPRNSLCFNEASSFLDPMALQRSHTEPSISPMRWYTLLELVVVEMIHSNQIINETNHISNHQKQPQPARAITPHHNKHQEHQPTPNYNESLRSFALLELAVIVRDVVDWMIQNKPTTTHSTHSTTSPTTSPVTNKKKQQIDNHSQLRPSQYTATHTTQL